MISCLILAAGQGSRLRPLTDNCPKGLVPLLGRSLVERQLDVLKAAGVERIALVTGYKSEKLEALGYQTFHNPAYNQSNMVESLFSARKFMEDATGDLLVSYADIVYECANLKQVLGQKSDLTVMVDEGWLDLWQVRNEDPLDDAETLKLDNNGFIKELGKRPQSLADIEGQYTGLIKIAHDKIQDFVKFYDGLDRNATYDGKEFSQMYMTSLLQSLIDSNWQLKAALVMHGWLEVDTVKDLELYEQLYASGELAKLWRPYE